MATHSSILALRIPGMGEPGGLSSMGSQRVRHDWSDLAAAAHAKPTSLMDTWSFPWWLRRWSICLQCRKPRFSPWVGKIPWTRKWQPTPVFMPGEAHGQRSLVGCSPWGHKESDMTEWLTNTQTQTHRLLVQHGFKWIEKYYAKKKFYSVVSICSLNCLEWT